MRFKNTNSGDVIDVPDELGGMYGARPDWEAYDPQVGDYPAVDPAATAPAGATGSPVPLFDPETPLAAGPVAALANVEDIKGASLEEALTELGLDTKGSADDKRERLAARLNEEVNGG